MSKTTVKRRHVFYVPGYDPFPPRRYREMYRRECARQAEISGYEIGLKPKKKGASRFGWSVEARMFGQETQTDIDVMYWADIVRAHMDRRIWPTYRKIPKMIWGYLSTGAILRMMRLRPTPVFLAFMYPIALLLGQLLLALAVAGLLGAVLSWLISPWLSPLGLAVVPKILQYFRRIDDRFYGYYLIHDYAYPIDTKGAFSPDLEARITQFVAAVKAALQSDIDEVLVVGHSSGAQLSVAIVMDVLRQTEARPDGPALSLLTLGHVVPMSTFLPKADRLRRDLHDLCQSDRLVWADITAPADAACFALCDPVAVSGVAPKQGKRWPLVKSAVFARAMSKESWKALRWKIYDCHLQYLRAFERPQGYDYFSVTAGPRPLADRIKQDWRASPSRIERPINPYRRMAP